MNVWLKRYGFAALLLGIDLFLFSCRPLLAISALTHSAQFLWEIALIVPTVTVLMGLFDIWVPRALVEAHAGPSSGFRGVLLAMLLGTAAAGPIYAAFPVALSLRQKGARYANVVIFLGTWASIKIPMVLVETRFLGLRFAMLRLALTVPGVLAAGFIAERLLAHPRLAMESAQTAD